MRVAGSTKILPGLASGFGEDSTRLDQFLDLHALLRSKGYSDQAAQVAALSMLSGEQQAARMTPRFAGTQGLLLPQDD